MSWNRSKSGWAVILPTGRQARSKTSGRPIRFRTREEARSYARSQEQGRVVRRGS